MCVGVSILCNYASSSNSNDTPAGIVCSVPFVLLTTVSLKHSSFVLNSFCRIHFWSTNGAGSTAGGGNCIDYDHMHHLQVDLNSQCTKENDFRYFKCNLLWQHVTVVQQLKDLNLFLGGRPGADDTIECLITFTSRKDPSLHRRKEVQRSLSAVAAMRLCR